MYVNLDILKTYSDGDNEFLIEMIEKFNKEMPAVLDNLQNALDQENWDEVRQIAHKMIGTTGVFYIMEATPHLQKIEQICMDAPTSEKVAPHVSEVRKICEAAMQELETEKNNL